MLVPGTITLLKYINWDLLVTSFNCGVSEAGIYLESSDMQSLWCQTLSMLRYKNRSFTNVVKERCGIYSEPGNSSTVKKLPRNACNEST